MQGEGIDSEKSRVPHFWLAEDGGVVRSLNPFMKHSRKFRQLISLTMVVVFSAVQFPVSAFSKNLEVFDPHKISVAVIPYAERNEDKKILEKTKERIAGDLRKISYFTVVDPKRVEEIVTYYAGSIRRDSAVQDEERSLALARAHWFSKDYLEAEADLERTIASLKRKGGQGDLLVDALLTKAMLFKETGRTAEAKKVFREALAIDPTLELEATPLSGKSRRVFEATKKEILLGRTGNLEIKSEPPMAQIYLNGVSKGTTPHTLENLPQGSYLVTIEANNYYPVHEAVYVAGGTTQFVSQTLHWIAGSAKQKVDPSRLAQQARTAGQKTKLAVEMGKALKVDKVLFLSVARRDGKEEVEVSTVDTSLKAAYNPLSVPVAEVKANEEKSLGRLANAIDDQARRNVLDDPAKYLQPGRGDIRTLRHERPFWQKPLFYSLTGALVGGAIGATVGILAAVATLASIWLARRIRAAAD